MPQQKKLLPFLPGSLLNVLVVLHVVFYITRYMYGARCQDFALSASFVSELECFDGSEVTAKRQ